MGEKKLDKWYTISEYLLQENQAEIKSEFDKGEILAMSGGSINHSRIGTNLLYSLIAEMRKKGSSCEAFNADVHLFIEKVNSIVYPDIAVVCGKVESHDEDAETITNPVLIMEVLSKSTAAYDRGEKFFKYRTLSSLREYILVDQYKAWIDSYFLSEAGIWQFQTVTGTQNNLHLQSLKIDVALANIYQNVEGLKDI